MSNHPVYQTYALIDSGHGYKLERFGPYVISRPSAQAVWKPNLPRSVWEQADASFTREGESKWTSLGKIPPFWSIEIEELVFKLSLTDFGHLGIFPEQREFWYWLQRFISKAKAARGSSPHILNLFAYSGGATLAAAKGGGQVCHLDASKGMVQWARENAALSGLENAPIRWIVDDVSKFLAREIRRGVRYDGIILDPPTFGRGSKGEVFKIEDSLQNLLSDCLKLLSSQPLFILFSCHTPGFTPLVMRHLLTQMMADRPGKLDTGEMVLEGDKSTLPLPSGVYARWYHES